MTPHEPPRARAPRALLLAVVGALVAVAAGCGDDAEPVAAGDPRPVELILDWFPNADHAGVYGAIEQGYLAEQGIDLEPTVPSDPAAALKQVAAGRAPFAISYEPEVLLARAQDIPVKAVAAIVVHPLNAVLVREDRGITRPADLAGKVVGAAGLPSDRPLLDTVVASDGGDPAAVETKNVGFNLAPALASGQVDALIGAYWNVEVPELEAKGVEVETFRLEEHGVPDYDELVLVTSDAVAREDPELIRAVLRGLRRGQDWAAADQAGAADHLLAANPDLDREVLLEQLRLTAPVLSPTDGPTLGLDPAEWEAYTAWMREAGILTAPLRASDAVTAEFLPAEEEER